MCLYLKLAWRNIFRNKRRTFIAGSAIGIGLAALIYVDALMIGMEENMIRSVTSSFLGEGQIHHQGYLETFEIEQTIAESDKVIARLKNEDIVEHFTPRVMSFSMISSPANTATVTMVGVEPTTEKNLSQIDDALITGAYFESDKERNIIIGSKLAELLETKLGDRVVLTAAQAQTGDLAQEMFRISGIYHFNVSELDRGMAFVRLEKARKMLNLPDRVHEIAMKLTDITYASDENLPLWRNYSTGGNKAIGWPELMPELKAAFDLSQFSTLILGLVLFGIVALGIINTLFMSLYERMFEFGVMRAVGTRPMAIGRLIVFEAGALAVVSCSLGIILGYILTYIITRTGIDWTGIEFAGATFREPVYPVIQLRQYILYPVVVLIFTLIIGLYPASFAARMNAARAMRKSF